MVCLINCYVHFHNTSWFTYTIFQHSKLILVCCLFCWEVNFGGFDEFLIEAALRLLLENHSLWRVSSQYILAFLSYALEPWVGHAQRIVSMFKTHLASPLKKKKDNNTWDQININKKGSKHFFCELTSWVHMPIQLVSTLKGKPEAWWMIYLVWNL